MLFFLKEKPVEIIACIPEEYSFAKEFSPIKPAKDLIPSWWKDLPNSDFLWDDFTIKSTVKSCPGIIQTITNGLIMPMWSDLALQIYNNEFKYWFADNLSSLDIHQNSQTSGFYNEYFKFKLTSPWMFKTPVKLMYMNPFYHITDPNEYIVPHGINTPISKYNIVASNYFIFVKNPFKERKDILIKQGTPLLHILPLTDKKIKFRIETLSASESKKTWSILGNRSNFVSFGLKNISKTKYM